MAFTSSSSRRWSMSREHPSGTARSARSFGTTIVTPVAPCRSARPRLSLGYATASPRTARTARRRFAGISRRSCSQRRPFGSATGADPVARASSSSVARATASRSALAWPRRSARSPSTRCRSLRAAPARSAAPSVARPASVAASRAAGRLGGLVLDRRAPLARGGGLGRERRQRRPTAIALARDGLEARRERRDPLAQPGLGGRRIRRGDPQLLLDLARGAQLVVGAGRERLGLGHVVGEPLDLAVDAHELRDELVPLRRGGAERAAIPPERAPAKIVADDLVLGPLRGLLGEELDARADLAKDVDDPDELDVGVLQPLERVLAA